MSVGCKGVTRVCQGCNEGVVRAFEGCDNSVTKQGGAVDGHVGCKQRREEVVKNEVGVIRVHGITVDLGSTRKGDDEAIMQDYGVEVKCGVQRVKCRE